MKYAAGFIHRKIPDTAFIDNGICDMLRIPVPIHFKALWVCLCQIDNHTALPVYPGSFCIRIYCLLLFPVIYYCIGIVDSITISLFFKNVSTVC